MGARLEAERIMEEIEAARGPALTARTKLDPMRIRPRKFTPLSEVFTTLFITYRGRALLGLTLMAAQAFFYNAIFFTYALVLTNFYRRPSHDVGWYILPFALGNVLGPSSSVRCSIRSAASR